jgi:hypothetical protein
MARMGVAETTPIGLGLPYLALSGSATPKGQNKKKKKKKKKKKIVLALRSGQAIPLAKIGVAGHPHLAQRGGSATPTFLIFFIFYCLFKKSLKIKNHDFLLIFLSLKIK